MARSPEAYLICGRLTYGSQTSYYRNDVKIPRSNHPPNLNSIDHQRQNACSLHLAHQACSAFAHPAYALEDAAQA